MVSNASIFGRELSDVEFTKALVGLWGKRMTKRLMKEYGDKLRRKRCWGRLRTKAHFAVGMSQRYPEDNYFWLGELLNSDSRRPI